MELVWGGERPVQLHDGSTRTWLEDGDTVIGPRLGAVTTRTPKAGSRLGQVTGNMMGVSTRRRKLTRNRGATDAAIHACGRCRRRRDTASFESPSGRLAEEMMGQSGFSGASSLLYHSHSPSALIDAKPARGDAMRHRNRTPAFSPITSALVSSPAADDPVDRAQCASGQHGRHGLLGQLRATTSDLYRNAAGDELVYVFAGSGMLESVFGTLRSSRATTWSFLHRRLTDGPSNLRSAWSCSFSKPPAISGRRAAT